jgi:predicted MFS family arabinose efflux permease
MVRPDRAFIRDRPTLLAYGALGAYTFWLYGFGPALALLREELRFSYTTIGVYSAVWAGGSVVSAATFAAAAGRIGRRALLWWSALVATGGAMVFVATHTVALTLAGAAALGFAGTTLQATTQSVLADHHGVRRDRALVEANVGAAACAVLAPLALGLFEATALTWRLSMALPALALAGLYLIFRHEPFPAAAPVPACHTGGSRLPLACRLLCLLVAVGIGAEFCVVYFGPELLAATTGLPTSAAGAAMTLFYAGILAGRLGGARLTGRRSTGTLLWISLALGLTGLLAMWLSAATVVALTGLFAAGLGVANLFPLSLALALSAARGQTDVANARAQLHGGLLVVIAPFVLGALADHLGLVAAFAVTPALIALAGVLLGAGQYRERPSGPVLTRPE